MSAQEVQPRFRTDDLALAAVLHIEDFRFNVEARGRKAIFIFESCDDLQGIVDDYHDGVHQCEPRSLAQAMGHCRKLMYEALGIGRRNGRQ